MSGMLIFCAAFGSFHVKSSSTSLMIVLVTVRVLPFFLTVTLMRSGTLIVSSFGARSYSDQRYRSMQLASPRHSSRFSGRGIGESGKAACTIAALAATPSSRNAGARGASKGAPWAAADVARLPGIGVPVFSMGAGSKERNPAATHPARTSVPHNAAQAASRGGLLTSYPVRGSIHAHETG